MQRLCGQDKSLWEQASDHVVDTGDVDFIASFLKIGMLVTGYALLTLCRKHNIIGSVVEKVEISFEDLVAKSAQADPILSLEKFMSLLNRMWVGDGLVVFIQVSTRYLFVTRNTNLIYSRLDALESGKIFHASARVYQTQFTFLFGAKYQDQSWIESFYNYPTMLPNVYANALICAESKGTSKIFSKDCWRKGVKKICK